MRRHLSPILLVPLALGWLAVPAARQGATSAAAPAATPAPRLVLFEGFLHGG